ncbi:hypothetical protein OC861_000633 [Tilletia horrida]|nr:hypothetical protein OC861_000633 [Tilletia horrida]
MTSAVQAPQPANRLGPGQNQAEAESLLPFIQTTTHLVSIPNRSFLQHGGTGPSSQADPLALHNSHFVVNIVHLRDSLAVWVGSATKDVVERAAQKQKRPQANGGHTHDDALDQELADALRSAGRLDDPEPLDAPSQPLGSLATEWAVAMCRPGQNAPLGTSLFRTNTDVALPMSQRLAARLRIPQLFVSLDLPPSLLSINATAMVPDPPGRAKKMLLLERGISDAIKEGIKIVEQRRSSSSSLQQRT